MGVGRWGWGGWWVGGGVCVCVWGLMEIIRNLRYTRSFDRAHRKLSFNLSGRYILTFQKSDIYPTRVFRVLGKFLWFA